MKICTRLTLAVLGAATLLLLLPENRRHMWWIRARNWYSSPITEHGGAPLPPVAMRDAGWVRVLDRDTLTLRGRGQLLVWRDLANFDGDWGLEGRIESFTGTSDALVSGDVVRLFPEDGGEQLTVTVERIGTLAGRPVLYLDWGDEQLPVSLRELIGH